VIARYKRASGYDVFFNTGTDEHGSNIYDAALKAGISTQEYVDKYALRFKEFHKLANISYDGFIRTTDDKHIAAAKKMWELCSQSGDIYKKNYKTKYCKGCELEKTDSELVDGKCPDHPTRIIEEREEENYFFRWSKYQGRLLELYKSMNNNFVIPESKQNEIKSFVEMGLNDFSISRLKNKMPWGVGVPGDGEHVMYVWFDALTSYISTLGWGTDNVNFTYWTEGNPVQYCGKDNNRQQSAMWQAMLMSAGINNSSHIIVNGFIQSGGMKMSKSTGNVISPFDIISNYKDFTNYPEDVLRFVLSYEISSTEDSDITSESIRVSYINNLQNGIGNQVNRIMKLASTYLDTDVIQGIISEGEKEELDSGFTSLLDKYKISEAARLITNKVKSLDEYIQETEPFKLVKIDTSREQGKVIIAKCVSELMSISHHLYFFMPNTSMHIYNCIKDNSMPETPIFKRLI
jgi:methionyl-tRNA synthetase